LWVVYLFFVCLVMRVLKVLLIWIFAINLFSFSFAEDDSWTLIPKPESNKAWYINTFVWTKVKGNNNTVWDNYNWASDNLVKDDVWLAFATWVFSWDTIFAFLKHIAKLLSEIWLVIWAGMIIYAGYKYATGVFTGDASKWGKDAIKGAIYGLLIVIFSYAIMRLLLAMFW